IHVHVFNEGSVFTNLGVQNLCPVRATAVVNVLVKARFLAVRGRSRVVIRPVDTVLMLVEQHCVVLYLNGLLVGLVKLVGWKGDYGFPNLTHTLASDLRFTAGAQRNP